MKTVRCLVLGIWIVLSLTSRGNSQVPFAEESAAKGDVRETVFRYMFEHYGFKDVNVFCIAAERPLTDNFIRRLSEIKPHVVWASECDNPDSKNGVGNKKRPQFGLYISISSLLWIRGEEAEVKVTVRSAGIIWNANTLRVSYIRDHWTVASNKVDFEY